MNRLVAGIAASTVFAATVFSSVAASAEDYTFTVPVSLTGSPKSSVSVTCAVAASGAKLTYDTSSGNIVGGMRNVSGGDGYASAPVNLTQSGSTYNGTATVRVSATLPTVSGGGQTGLQKGAAAPAPTYMCAANAGSSAYYTTAPVVSGNLPIR